MMVPDVARQANIQRYNDRRFRAYCCGCIDNSANDIIVCFFWAVLSFYFAVLAFLQKSPFYSYIQTVPLVVFGAVNLLFGIVTLCGIVLLLFRPRIDARIMGMYQSRKTVFTITANAVAVLIVTLINFILFVIDKEGFFHWCITSSASYVTQVYDQMNNNSTEAPPITLESGSDLYNCERLYEDEVKWSFLCFVVMSIVYIHWILIVAARTTYQFFNRIDIPQQAIVPTEYGNMAPSSKKKSQKKNTWPSRSLLEILLTHKQYSEHIPQQSKSESLMKEKPNVKELMNDVIGV